LQHINIKHGRLHRLNIVRNRNRRTLDLIAKGKIPHRGKILIDIHRQVLSILPNLHLFEVFIFIHNRFFYLVLSAIRNPLSAIGPRPPIRNPLSADRPISPPPSAISYQLSAISYQLSVDGGLLLAVDLRPDGEHHIAEYERIERDEGDVAAEVEGEHAADEEEEHAAGLVPLQVLLGEDRHPQRHQERGGEHAEEWPEIHHPLPQTTKIFSGLADKSPE